MITPKELNDEVTIEIGSGKVDGEIGHRRLLPRDVPGIKKLYEDCFPLRYNQRFYDEMERGKYDGNELLSYVTTSDGYEVVGCISSTIKDRAKDRYGNLLLANNYHASQTCCYVLTLAVNKDYRRRGIATTLLQQTIAEAEKRPDCQVIYLHVITYNTSAMAFYETNGFTKMHRVNGFYSIKGQLFDSFIFAKYMNSGQAPLPKVSIWSSLISTIYSLFEYLLKGNESH